MRYLPGKLNQAKLFFSLNSVMSDTRADHKVQDLISQFLYRATCVIVSVEKMIIAQKFATDLVDAYKQQIIFGEDNRIAVSVEPLFEVYAQIPSALSQIVIMQNQILKICEFYFKINGNAPSSFNKALKKNLTQYGFTQELADLVTDYWENGGKYVRDVRNINEHHKSLVDNSFYIISGEETRISVLLPDNPEVKSINDLRYANEIDAVDVIIRSLRELDQLFSDIFSDFKENEKPFTQSLELAHMGDLVEEQERTLGLLINITDYDATEEGTKIKLDTIEIKQTLPNENGGNVSVRKMVPDNEL